LSEVSIINIVNVNNDNKPKKRVKWGSADMYEQLYICTNNEIIATTQHSVIVKSSKIKFQRIVKKSALNQVL